MVGVIFMLYLFFLDEGICIKKYIGKCVNFKVKIFEVFVYLMLFNGKKNIIC